MLCLGDDAENTQRKSRRNWQGLFQGRGDPRGAAVPVTTHLTDGRTAVMGEGPTKGQESQEAGFG